jgi:hypothetical protein
VSYLWLNNNGKLNTCDNGYVRLSDCPGFDCRPVCYVDKKATGTGDGSSWANAYTDIQTAINANPCKEIQIKGYGENDCYPGEIELKECTFLKGVDDMWIDSSENYVGIDGKGLASTLIDSVNIKNSPSCFHSCNEIRNCKIKNFVDGFIACNSLSGCIGESPDTTAYGSPIFSRYTKNIENCSCIGYCAITFGDYEICTNCYAEGSGIGFVPFPLSIAIGCTVVDTEYAGFQGLGGGGETFIDCIARDNKGCGFIGNSTFINCEDINNCLESTYSCRNNLCAEV